MDFLKFKNAVVAQFELMMRHDMYRTSATKSDLWDTYLGSFPPGSNPIFRVRTVHDGSYDKQFIRAVGNAVADINGNLVSVWDVTIPGEPEYQIVADAMSAYVKSLPIVDLFRHDERFAGHAPNFEEIDGKVHRWEHFYVEIASRSNSRNYFMEKANIPTFLGKRRTAKQVLERGIKELTPDAFETVLDLISQNSLYRGTEKLRDLKMFREVQIKYLKLKTDLEKELFLWNQSKDLPEEVVALRGSAMGTLLIDLSEDLDLDEALRKYEKVMAPANYKRPTGVVSKKQVEKAKDTLGKLGYLSSLERRYATVQDISINDIIYANRDARKAMDVDVFDSIATKSDSPKNFDKVEEISIEKFIQDIVPRAETIEVLLENKHVSNLVSLVAPADKSAPTMFKWDNNYSWSYNGDVADSVKERVKRAGGNVTGDFCCRLGWYNYDDLDFHMTEPDGTEIYYSNRMSRATGGQLDVDMNAGAGTTREAVENIFYTDSSRMKDGIYTLRVHNFALRERVDVGFEVEIDFKGQVYNFHYDKMVKDREFVTVAKMRIRKGHPMEIIESMPHSKVSKSIWNMKTNEFQKVNVLTLSPNYWGDKNVGNKHYMFMLQDAKNEGVARGFYNEFLKPELNEHRKVMEIVGSKMKTDQSEDQLSGLGFSSTQEAEVLVRVKGAVTRTLKVMI